MVFALYHTPLKAETRGEQEYGFKSQDHTNTNQTLHKNFKASGIYITNLFKVQLVKSKHMDQIRTKTYSSKFFKQAKAIYKNQKHIRATYLNFLKSVRKVLRQEKLVSFASL